MARFYPDGRAGRAGVPALFSLERPFVDVGMLAGGLAAVVAWRTRSMIATIGIGMVVLWAAPLVIG